MGYKYYPEPNSNLSASSVLIEHFQAAVTDLFEVSSDIYNIEEEVTFGSELFKFIKVRITSALDVLTQTRLGDDFKRILFPDINHTVFVGKKYRFSNNIWIGWNLENIKTLTSSLTVRRCNNVLRWMSVSGSTIYYEPCAIEYEVTGVDNNVSSDDLVLPNGKIKVYAQQNDRTNTITENRRFIFGNTSNWIAYRIVGGGIRNYLNADTYDNNSSRLLELKMEVDYVNESTDDLINGIADRYLYTTSGSSSAINNIVITPSDGNILEGESEIFDVHYYSGSSISSGSFIFTVYDNNVPSQYYDFAVIDGNTFKVDNNGMYLDYPLNILCSGSSGSRIFEISLLGRW